MYQYYHFQNHPVKTYLFLMRAATIWIAAHFFLVIRYPFPAHDIRNRFGSSNFQIHGSLFNQ